MTVAATVRSMSLRPGRGGQSIMAAGSGGRAGGPARGRLDSPLPGSLSHSGMRRRVGSRAFSGSVSEPLAPQPGPPGPRAIAT